jgi:hypothetical protein
MGRDALFVWALHADAKAYSVPGEPVLGSRPRGAAAWPRLVAESEQESVDGTVLALGLVQGGAQPRAEF